MEIGTGAAADEGIARIGDYGSVMRSGMGGIEVQRMRLPG
jgi:hypothetical protein